MTLNTLRLLHALLTQQQVSVGAAREEIEAVLTARDELEAAIAQAEATSD
jgi:hypothetical protein